jgi:hypothetical protein
MMPMFIAPEDLDQENEFIFTWLQAEKFWSVDTYFRRAEGGWTLDFRDGAHTSETFGSAPTLDDVERSLSDWSFAASSGRGALLKGELYLDAWVRAVGEPPDGRYPGMEREYY